MGATKMLSIQILNQLHIEFNQLNDIDYSGVLIGENTVFKSIKIEEYGDYLKNYILVFNKSCYEIDLWCVDFNRNTFNLTLEYMYNLVDCMDIDHANKKPILDWVYQSLSFDNIIDCVERLIK